MTTIAPPAAAPTAPPSHVAALTKALGGKPCHDPHAPCQPCARYELQLLVTLPSVVAAEHESALKDAGYAWAPSFDKAFTELPRQATHPVARLARAGYVYLHYADWQTWDVWQVMPNGLARKLLHQVDRTRYDHHQSALSDAPPAKLCSQGAANVPAHLIGIYGARNATRVWLAFSPRLWTGAVLQRYADNPEVEIDGPDGKPLKTRLRAVRGIEVNPKAIVAGQFPTQGALPLNEAALRASVVEYCARPEGAVVPAWPSLGFGKTFAEAPYPLTKDRFGQAAGFAQRVRQLELALSPGNHPRLYEHKTLIVMLPDAEGVANAHNTLRLSTLREHQGWMAGGPDASGRNADPQRPWQRQSLLHAGYIREWVKDEERKTHQDRLDHGLYRTRHVISAVEYQQIQAQERRSGQPVNPPGTTYEKLPGTPERYRITFPEKAARQGIEGLAAAGAKGRIERYHQHLDWHTIEQVNQKWKAQEEGWLKLLQARDADYVRWLQSPALHAVLGYDFDDAAALQQAQRKPEELKRDVQELASRLQALATCYGGGACSDASLGHLVELFKKDEHHKSHYIAQAMLGELGLNKLLDKAVNDPGTQADLYDMVLAGRAAWTEFTEAWAHVREQAAASSAVLLQTAYQVTQRMQEAALLPAQAQQRGLQVALADAARKQVVWARAAGFARFLETGQRQYVLGVKWKAGAFAEALTELSLTGPALDVDKREVTGKQARKAAKATRAELKPLLARNTAELDTTVMLVLDERQLAQAAQARGEKMLDIVSPGLFGRPAETVRVPESLAKAVVREYVPANKARAMMSTASGLNAAGLVLQWWALAQSWEDLQKKGGAEQTDAAFSALGSLAGVMGAAVEIGALLLAPAAEKATQGTPAAAVMASLPAHLWLRFAAGLMLAAGAGFDAGVAFVRARNKKEQGDRDSFVSNFASTGLHLGGLFSLGAGAWYAHRARVLAHYGQEAVVRILARSIAPVQLGRCLTGVGLVLWIGGVAWSLYALYLEDDDNEIFLRRSFFGKGHPQLGKFQNLEEETAFLGALAIGAKAELEWHDRIGPDGLTVRVRLFKPEPAAVVMAVVEGFDAIDGKPLATLHDGLLPEHRPSADKGEADKGIHVTELQLQVPDGVKAVRLKFSLYRSKNQIRGWRPEASGDVWVED